MDIVDFRFWASLTSVLMLAGVQAAYPWIERQSKNHMAQITALAGGIAVGYAALYLLPKIGNYTASLTTGRPDLPEFFQYQPYFFLLAGVVVYFLVHSVRTEGRALPTVLSGGAFLFYSFMTGSMLEGLPRPGYFPYILAGGAMCLHFLGICHQLRERNTAGFDRYVRWMLAAFTLMGWIAGTLGMLSEGAVAVIVAFLGGGILVNVLREEWPEQTPGRTAPFLVGVGLFAVLAVIMRSFFGI